MDSIVVQNIYHIRDDRWNLTIDIAILGYTFIGDTFARHAVSEKAILKANFVSQAIENRQCKKSLENQLWLATMINHSHVEVFSMNDIIMYFQSIYGEITEISSRLIKYLKTVDYRNPSIIMRIGRMKNTQIMINIKR